MNEDHLNPFYRQTINCAFMTRPDWLWEVNPFGKVPVLLYKVTVAMINEKIKIVRSFAGESDLRVPGHL